MILAFDQIVRIYVNTEKLSLNKEFCLTEGTSFSLYNSSIDISVPENHYIKEQSLHFGDINIDGYPDLLVVLVDQQNKREKPMLF